VMLRELKQYRESNINKMIKSVHQNAKDHGWWEDERSFGDIVSLCHCELSEAMEEFRNGHKPNEIYYSGKNESGICCESRPLPTMVCKKPEGIPIELADVIIRIFDYCGHAEIDIKSAIIEKMEYNKDRPYKHGGKVI